MRELGTDLPRRCGLHAAQDFAAGSGKRSRRARRSAIKRIRRIAANIAKLPELLTRPQY
jgi:hypothetical protein